MCPAVVPCAMADEESGSKFKTWILCGSTLRVTRCKKIALKILFFQMNPCIKISFPQINPSLILDLPCVLYSVYTPSVGVVGLAEYVCTHPFPNFYRERSRLPVDRVTRRKLRMAQDSNDLFVVNIVVWVLVIILAIVALHCPLPRRVVW